MWLLRIFRYSGNQAFYRSNDICCPSVVATFPHGGNWHNSRSSNHPHCPNVVAPLAARPSRAAFVHLHKLHAFGSLDLTGSLLPKEPSRDTLKWGRHTPPGRWRGLVERIHRDSNRQARMGLSMAHGVINSSRLHGVFIAPWGNQFQPFL